MITSERMSEQFQKLHLQIGKFPITLHHFTGPDVGDAHDHPFSFTTTILAGGYIEEIWDRRAFDLEWIRWEESRLPGDVVLVPQGTIHRIIALPEGECVTSVKWHDQAEQRHETRFYRLIGGVMRSRQWNEPDFTDA